MRRSIVGRSLVAGAVVFGTLGFLMQDAAAVTKVKLKQRVSESRLKEACAEAGGVFGNTRGGGYTCDATRAGSTVKCDKNGNCTGWVLKPAPSGSHPRLESVLGVKAASANPVVRDHRDPKPVVRDHRSAKPKDASGGVTVAPTPTVRDHRDPKPKPVVRDHRD